MKRIFHHYEKWEDWRDGFYCQDIKEPTCTIVHRSARLLASPNELYRAMKAACEKYPHSAEVNLSNRSRNRQAWLGQAACCWVVGATEDLTKAAWHTISLAEQMAANAVADRVISEWEVEHA